MEINKHVLTVAELTTTLALGRSTIYKLINKPDFPKIRIGRRVLIPVDPLKKWLEMNIGTVVDLSS
jgi:excisionase family DNA binding protein